ncbi:hypothetical protein COB57_00780 [Candidatus Peregrinibacteria bacterium]|nr:MAG: hypothetical protein COB57_00780 [Candidatus Peregrinibacteria bacterium]
MPYFAGLRHLFNVEAAVTPAELKKAYRNLSKEYHPDINPSPEAEKRMKKMTHAYEILTDEDKKKAYEKEQRENIRLAQKADAKKKKVAKNRKNKKRNKKR